MKHYPNNIELENYIESLNILEKLNIYMHYFVIYNTPICVQPGIVYLEPKRYSEPCLWDAYVNPKYEKMFWTKVGNISSVDEFTDKSNCIIRVCNKQDKFSYVKYSGIYDFVLRFNIKNK